MRGGGAELGRSFCRSGGWKSMGVCCSVGIGVCEAGVGNGVGTGKGYASLATGVGLQRSSSSAGIGVCTLVSLASWHGRLAVGVAVGIAGVGRGGGVLLRCPLLLGCPPLMLPRFLKYS